MGLRFRIGPFTFGSSGIRLSLWSRGTGISIPLTNREKSKTFSNIKAGPLNYFSTEKSKSQIRDKSEIPFIQKIKKTHTQAYEPWSKDAETKLVTLFHQGKSVKELSEIFGRTTGAIRARIDKLLLR